MKKLIFLMMPIVAFSQYNGKVGINTDKPKATLDVAGDARIRNLAPGVATDSILVVNDGFIRKIAFSDLNGGFACPNLLKAQSGNHYLIFKSASSIPNPNDAIVANGLDFISAGTWILSNNYYFSYSNTTGTPLNINNFSVNFGNKKCNY